MSTPRWRQEGEDPDYRFTLANERTFLAWIRTALATLAIGVLLDQFSSRLQPTIVVVVLALTLCLLSGIMCVFAYRRWRAIEIAMRHKQALPSSILQILLTLIALGLSLTLVVLLIRFTLL